MLTTPYQSSTVASLQTELIAAGEGLADNADVLRSVLAGCGDCIKILDLAGRLQFMSEGGKRVMEVEDFETIKGCPWSSNRHRNEIGRRNDRGIDRSSTTSLECSRHRSNDCDMWWR